MALDKSGLVTDIKQLVATMRAKDTDDDDAYASGLANAIEKYVKSGDVQPNITVQVTPNTGLGKTTGTGKIQ